MSEVNFPEIVKFALKYIFPPIVSVIGIWKFYDSSKQTRKTNMVKNAELAETISKNNIFFEKLFIELSIQAIADSRFIYSEEIEILKNFRSPSLAIRLYLKGFPKIRIENNELMFKKEKFGKCRYRRFRRIIAAVGYVFFAALGVLSIWYFITAKSYTNLQRWIFAPYASLSLFWLAYLCMSSTESLDSANKLIDMQKTTQKLKE